MEAIDHLEWSAEVLLVEVVKHPCIDQALHEGTAVLGQSQRRQPLIADPLMIHVTKCKGLKHGNQ